MVVIASSEITFDEDSYHVEISKYICIPNQLTGFYIAQVSAGGTSTTFCVVQIV